MATFSLGRLRDSAIVIFAYCKNGLRDSFVTSIVASNSALTEEEMTARLTVLKEEQAIRAQLLQYPRMSNAPQIDLWHWFRVARASVFLWSGW